MRFKKRYLVIVPVLVLIFLFANFFRPKPIVVETTKVERGSLEQKISATGKISSEEEVDLSFRITGKVLWLGPKVGNFVKEGQTIASLDGREAEINLSQKEAGLRSAQSDLEKVLDDIRLFQYGNPEFKGETETQENLRERAEAQKDIAFEAVLAARENLRHTVLTSPISGTLVAKNTEVGQNITAGTPLFKVANLAKLVFVVDVDEGEIEKVKIDKKAKIKLDAYPEKEFEGKVIRIFPQTSTTQTGATVVKIEIKILNDLPAKLGLSGDAEIIVDERESALILPTESVFEEGDKKYVFVLRGSKAEKREVVLGLSLEDRTEARAGILEGEVVISSNVARVTNGTKIKRAK